MEGEAEANEILTLVKTLASYCYGCSACNTVCPTNYLNIFSPKDFLKRLSLTSFEKFDDFIKNESLFNCLTCQQCYIYCPMANEKDGIQFVDIIQKIRAYAYSRKLLEPQLKEHQTHDDITQVIPQMQSISPTGTNKIDFILNDSKLKIAQQGQIGRAHV